MNGVYKNPISDARFTHREFHVWKVGGYADLDERIRCRELLAATSCIPDIRINAEDDRNVGMDRNATIKIKDVMSLSSTRTKFTILRDINRTLR